MNNRIDRCQCFIEEIAEARFDAKNGLKRLVGRGGGKRRGNQKSEGGPEIIDTFCYECSAYWLD